LPSLALFVFAVPRVSAQTTVSVPATANIYGAGFATAPAPNGSGGGVLPTSFSLPTGTSSLTITGVTGSVTFAVGTATPNAADGGTSFSALTQLSAWNSLSGITYNGRTTFLVGVFLDGSEPSGTAPATLVFNDSTAGLTSYSPLLRQVFFVGDGLDAVSAAQSFNVPTGATRFFLGFADSWNGSSITGTPGNYLDNSGTLSVTITAIPEPAAVAWWLAIGAGTVGWMRRRRS
jgi:hypothetical protein